MQPLEMIDPGTSDDQFLTLGKFGTVLGDLVGTQVSVLGEDHIRISTPSVIDDKEIRRLKEFITDSLYLPVTIFRENSYIEITSI